MPKIAPINGSISSYSIVYKIPLHQVRMELNDFVVEILLLFLYNFSTQGFESTVSSYVSVTVW